MTRGDLPSRRPPSLRTLDLLRESGLDIVRRPGRSFLTALGTLLGVGVLVAAYGLAQTASAQIGERFDLLEATQVTVVDTAIDVRATPPFPADAEERLARLNGVVAAGIVTEVPLAHPSLRALWLDGAPDATYPVLALSPGALDAVDLRVGEGRAFGEFEQLSASRVALVGPVVRAQLGIERVDGRSAVWIDGVPFTVIGSMEDVGRRPDLLTGVAVPLATAERLWGIARPTLIIETAPGAAQVIGSQAALVLRPDDPGRLGVQVPPSPETLRRQVQGDLQSLVLALGAIILGVGAVQIANATLVSVLHRVNEIGLRRAVGATPRHIALQFLVESGALGFLGGLLGAQIGLLTVAVVSASKRWTLATDPWLLLVGPFLGLIVGTVAGMYPAWKAARIEPVNALRR